MSTGHSPLSTLSLPCCPPQTCSPDKPFFPCRPSFREVHALAEQYIELFDPEQMVQLLAALGGAIEPGLKREIMARLWSQMDQVRGGGGIEQMVHLLAALGWADEPGLKGEMMARLRSQAELVRGGMFGKDIRGRLHSRAGGLPLIELCLRGICLGRKDIMVLRPPLPTILPRPPLLNPSIQVPDQMAIELALTVCHPDLPLLSELARRWVESRGRDMAGIIPEGTCVQVGRGAPGFVVGVLSPSVTFALWNKTTSSDKTGWCIFKEARQPCRSFTSALTYWLT